MRIAWTRTARESPREIRAYIARGSPVYPQRTVERIVGAVRRLRDPPHAGRVIPEANEPALREVILGSQRICYRVDGDEVRILLLFHAARLLDPARLRENGR